MVCANLKDSFYPSPLNVFKIARTSFGVIIFQDFAAPSLQNDALDLQTGQSGRPILANGKYSESQTTDLVAKSLAPEGPMTNKESTNKTKNTIYKLVVTEEQQ